jgi:hypothetical protein
MESWKMWSGKHAERQAPHGATKRITSAPPAHHLCTTRAPPAHLSESVVVDTVEDERITSAPPAHHLCTTPAPPAHRRARSFLRKESDTTAQGEESGSPDLVPSPPPAEPSGFPADIWSRAADLAEGAGLSEMETPTADPEAWRAFEEFQPSSDAYVFEDAEPVGAYEQPSDPRQIESPAQPFDPIEEFATPSPPPSASPAARPRGLSSEGAPGPAGGPQDAPSLFGRTDTAPEASAPAKAPPRARKATAADKAADALAVYGAWRVYHPRAAETPTPDTVKTLGRLLIEAGGLDGAMLLMEWAHVGTCERARQLRGEHPWPDGRRTVYTDLGSLSRHVAGRLEMARSWKEGATDKDSGLNVINLQPHTYRGPPNRTTRDIDFYKALELI